jgi:archaellum component FlaF (FlaF/FlaG flagellin family)
MKNSFFTLHFLAIIYVTLAFTSCKKDQEQVDNDTSSATDNSIAQQNFNDLTTMADEALRNGTSNIYKSGNSYSVLSACATIDLVSGTKVNFSSDGKDTITINFGSNNCLCNDGRYRRGLVQFVYTGPYRTSGTVITVTPSNYYVNDHAVQGVKTITNNGSGIGYFLRHTIVVNGTIVKPNGGGTITWNSTRTRDWVSGDTTLMWDDDVYQINGNANGTSAGGTNFSSTIISPLIRKFDPTNPVCRRYFTQGTIDHIPSGKPTRTIDFGNGTCDNLGTITVNGNVYTFQMP